MKQHIVSFKWLETGLLWQRVESKPQWIDKNLYAKGGSGHIARAYLWVLKNFMSRLVNTAIIKYWSILMYNEINYMYYKIIRCFEIFLGCSAAPQYVWLRPWRKYYIILRPGAPLWHSLQVYIQWRKAVSWMLPNEGPQASWKVVKIIN